MRVSSERPAQGGGWVHRLDRSDRPDVADAADAPGHTAAQAPVSIPSTDQPAALDRRDRIYRRLLAASTLDPRHKANLVGRGCSQAEVESWGCRTLMLQGRAKLARRCHNGHSNDLAGVPGFWVASGERGSYWTLSGSPGLLIPVVAPDKRVRALRIRPDEQGEGGKYRWFSSAGKAGGTGSGAHCHVARPKPADVTDPAVWVTEGELKANIAAARLGAAVVSIPGVSSWPLALPDILELLPGGGRVVVAMDADWRGKPSVHKTAWCLSRACAALGYAVEVALWPATHKGLDDLLVAGLSPQLTAPADLPEPAWEAKVSSVLLAESPAPLAVTAISLTDMRAKLREALAGLSRCT
jgi:hypothetical protein